MEKVWFKLRQTDYPPPTVESMGTSKETGPICLGHFISDLKHIDFVLNRGAIEEFPASMEVYTTNTTNFTWDDSQDSKTGGSLGAGGPIAAAAGLTVKASIKLAFSKSIHNYEEYKRLDSYIVQPKKAYVSECLDGDLLKAYVADRKIWSMFMITGLRVARKGTRTTSESSNVEVEGGPEVDIPTIATATATVNIARDQTQKTGGTHASDFVWAVRLAKVHKGLLMTDWSLDPYTKRATFGAGEEEVDVASTVSAEGLDKFLVIEDEGLGEVFVVDEDE